ncbi:hypothetical protein Hanom_Chr06g00490151 [Helianthus anomalus]
MNKHEQRPRSFIYVIERLVTSSFVFDSSLVFLVFIFYFNTMSWGSHWKQPLYSYGVEVRLSTSYPPRTLP